MGLRNLSVEAVIIIRRVSKVKNTPVWTPGTKTQPVAESVN